MATKTSTIKVPEFRSREDYKNCTKDFLSEIKNVDDDDRRNAVSALMVKLYDDLMINIDIAQKSEGETDAINDDAIEGILAVANTCIEEQNEKKKHHDIVIKLEKELYDILHDEKESIKARVNAFYCLCTKHRRIKDFRKFKELIQISFNNVCDDEIFKIMQAYYLIQETADDFDPEKALKYWNKSISKIYKRLPAFTQIYTETVVLECETTKNQEKELLDEAEHLINNAIKMREYPKFYSTLGRIYCCRDEYDKGIAEVRRAIEAEDSDREDYTSRIIEYQSLISRFQRKKDEKELKEQANGIRTELDKRRTDYIGILGFFSSVMALIIISIDIAKEKMPMIESLQLLMGFAGVIIFSFGSLNLMLAGREEKRTNKYSDWTMPVLGVCLFVLAFLIRLLYKYLENNNWI